MNIVEGLVLLAIGLFAAFLGWSGRVRYSGRAGCGVAVLIFVGLYTIFDLLFR